ncbi:MAG: NADH:ubiquinone reductase (Na(+)-transporting) subunit F [Bacteroidales bacterium]|jgi:Na+-transporting NADH:ubiquinone oxidoreductase subunit F|nr:NADH:ubiquinone reductase (Na(+)-transporting) subunit F [Bacteroidales bacterium]
MNYITIIISVVVFLAVIWLLVAVLLFARKKLVPEGNVDILVNGERQIEHERGCSLLQALGDNKIFMPSACGGGGTCGCCKGKVLEGGGTILPTETPHIDRKMQAENYRLFCQVKVKENLKIEIPVGVFGVKKWECTVKSNHNVATFIKEFVVTLPEGETIDFKSGGYIQIDVPPCTVDYKNIDVEAEYREDWEKQGLFNLVMKNRETCTRAYSMANHPQENDRIMLNVRIATPPFNRKKGAMMKVNPGVCSSYIFSLKEGDKVYVSGPYGEFFVQDTQNEMMFIGGGAGMAPMRSHIFDQFKIKHTQRKTTFWYGGRSKRELFYLNDFEEIEKENKNFSFHIALSEPLPEDNWSGDVGFIHQVIYERYLKNHPAPEDIEYYICGPAAMLNAVLQMLDNLGVPKSMIFYDDFGN